MWILLALVGGFLVGAVAASVFIYAKAIGSLRVDHSDPSEPPYLFLEVEKNPDTLEHGKIVVLRVKRENLISRE